MDEFVVDALRNRLVGIPLDLAAINIARGRENGIPSLNSARAQIQALTGNTAFAPYTDWVDFQFNGLKTQESAVNFVAAYGTHPSITSIDPQGVDATALRRAAADLLVNGGAGEPADRVDFMNGLGAYAADKGGLNDVDLWNGGLAEKREFDSGSLLGITHDYIFRFQMEALQEGDRFYYLHRLGGTNLLTSLEGNSLAEIVDRNTTATNLPSNVFSRPDFFFDLSVQTQNPPAAIIDDGATMDYNEMELLRRNPGDGTTVEFGPQSISGGEVGNTVGDEHTNWFGSIHDDRIDSGDGDDTLRGNEGDDYIQGDGGGDNIIGGAGDDILLDSSGDDDIKGGPGNDVISGGPGVDLLQGNDGDDLFVPGNDESEMLAGPGDDLIAPGPTASGSILGNGDDWAEGGNGGDGFSGDNDNPLDNAELGGDDVLIGDDGPDRLEGEGGEDIFLATGGSDGLDRYEGQLGYDWLANTPGGDLDSIGLVPPILEDRFFQVEGISGTAGDDILYGSGVQPPSVDPLTLEPLQRLDAATSAIDGIETIIPGPFFEDGNIILGGAGSDMAMGRGENDILHGDAVLDVYLWHAPTSTRYDSVAEFQADSFRFPGDPLRVNPGDIDIVREIIEPGVFADVDTAIYQGPIADYDITMIDPFTYEVAHVRGDGGTGLPTDDGIDLVMDFEMLEFIDAVMDISAPGCNGLAPTIDLNVTPGAVATAGPDVILGTPGADVIFGLGGDDTICGMGGDDTITGQGGNDTIFGGDGMDTIFGGDDNDTIFGGADADSIQGNDGVDEVNGNGGDDTLSGNDGDDTLNGGPDNDTLFGVAGEDTLNGDGGADTILGGLNDDTINGGDGDDLISGNAGADTINGDADNDTLYGSTEGDTINGGTGMDIILGGTGDDTINGGDDRDLLSGNENDDTINGGDGDDDIFGVDGADTLNGDGGVDLILGGNGNDIINGGSEGDLLSGNADNDTIDGGDGDDEIYGVTGEDILTGGAGVDIILGGPDNDTINSDNDGSIDQVSGNAGTDTCNVDLLDNVFQCELP
ncbi:MAG: peroxidase family protein [Acidimicrobiia bacterium]|nr:peroxidase family protein [Acidimicrobiia bacterium]